MKRVFRFNPISIFSTILKVSFQQYNYHHIVALQVFCVCVVTYEVYRATLKYLSNPVANVVYTVETELPMVTVCNSVSDIIFGPMPVKQDDLRFKGKFHPDDKEEFSKNFNVKNDNIIFSSELQPDPR